MNRETSVFLVPTPIGNLEDITIRAIEVLKNVDFILAEDTRNSAKLLKHYNIQTPMYAYHMHNEHEKTDGYISRVQQGQKLAIISDGGTPGISDPGYLMVRACIEKDIPFETLAGPTAFVPALVNSGFPNHNFLFLGFLPPKKGRETIIKKAATLPNTLIFYESPHKIKKLISQLNSYFSPSTSICISREISKIHEENIRGSIAEIYQNVEKYTWKGELVVLIDNNKQE